MNSFTVYNSYNYGMSVNIALTSKSNLKLSVLNRFFKISEDDSETTKYKISTFSIDDPEQCPQPFNLPNGIVCCKNRIDWLICNGLVSGFDYVISIENYIEVDEETDSAVIIIYKVSEGLEYMSFSDEIKLPDAPNSIILKCLLEKYGAPYGASKTYGEMYNSFFPDVPANNWMMVTARDRRDILLETFEELWDRVEMDLEFIRKLDQKFRYFPDFPIKGVQFMDWNDIFLDPTIVSDLIKYIAKKYSRDSGGSFMKPNTRINYVIGLESRGYLIGLPLALQLGCGFIPMRKPGKTPGQIVTKSYRKEYGEDCLELRADLPKGNVLIVDDVLATGGSLMTAIELAQMAGHTVIDCVVIRDVSPLRNVAEKTLKGIPVRILIKS